MAVQAQFGGFTGCLPYGEDYGALLSAAANNGYHCPGGVVVSGAQSELTCNGSGGGVVLPSSSSRKRGREADHHLEHYVSTSIPAMHQKASRAVDSAAASTSGRTSAQEDAMVLSELCEQHGAEIEALVRAECERLWAGLKQARKRQRQALVSLVAGAAARRLREKEAELDAARRRAAELEERVAQAAAESQAWCGLARGHEAVAAELRATLDHLLLRGAAEGFGESGADDGAQSCCFEAKDTGVATATATSAAGNKWGCKACGEGEASVLVLPCRHLCLCKACEPKLEACPVCLAAKNASIYVAPN